ncbi:MAG: radical SAM family heme chaperone HemW [Candidatus Pelagadaptatus aseana]|uniref:radical SAM family heme chaperone HemW n=1 Tax=Candidatus Pelagadaptatus aseana TaxID=3120508 RepID=UPI0039B1AC66
MELPPLSLYVHIPWCVRKCPYCDFNSHVATGVNSHVAIGVNAQTASDSGLPESDYIDCLLQDLAQDAHLVQGRPIHSIFFGGGTPSLFGPDSFARLLDQLEQRIGFESDIEITLEANPGTAEQQKFSGFREAGINRLSIGVQSFNGAHLQKLGRIHSSDEALRAVEMARTAGFDNLNLDLMHGLPDQTPEQACADLTAAIDCNPEHLSWYQLTVEPNTEFYSRPPLLPEDDLLADIQDAGEALLANAGFEHYEVSAYAQPGKPSRHNLNYWRFGDYLGLGAGAHGKITDANHHRIERRWKTRQPNYYLDPERDFCAGVRVIDSDDLPLEFMMNALRLVKGVETSLFRQRTGLSPEVLQPALQKLQQQELLSSSGERLQTTSLGMRYLNAAVGEFMRENQ